MSSYLDYIGRTVDLLAFAAPEDNYHGEQLMLANLAVFASGQICTGPMKLAQRCLLRLFTEQGSIANLPNEGTTFLTQMRMGTLRTTSDVSIAFSEAVTDIKAACVAEETEDDPLDERFEAMTLTNVAIVDQTIYLKVAFLTVAGTGVTVITPLKTHLGAV